MRDLLLFASAGFAASLVDGALGMGFGPTSSSILLGAGLAPTAVSASVNLAKVVTGLVAGDLALAVSQPRSGARAAAGGARLRRRARRRDRALEHQWGNAATLPRDVAHDHRTPHPREIRAATSAHGEGHCTHRRKSEAGAPLRPARREDRRVPGRRDQRHDWGLGTRGDALSLAPRRSPALRDRMCQYGRSRRGVNVGLLADRVLGRCRRQRHHVAVDAAGRSRRCASCSLVDSLRRAGADGRRGGRPPPDHECT